MGTLVSKTQPDLIGDEDDIQSWSSVSYRSNYQHYMPVELDPRSPTAGIERTPIQLPIQSAASLDPAGNIGRTPIATQTTSYQVSMLLDPRSPTIGIERTPIQVQLLKSPAALQDPRSPTVGIDRTPIICLASQSGKFS
jgi:hypothetical protein